MFSVCGFVKTGWIYHRQCLVSVFYLVYDDKKRKHQMGKIWNFASGGRCDYLPDLHGNFWNTSAERNSVKEEKENE